MKETANEGETMASMNCSVHPLAKTYCDDTLDWEKPFITQTLPFVRPAEAARIRTLPSRRLPAPLRVAWFVDLQGFSQVQQAVSLPAPTA